MMRLVRGRMGSGGPRGLQILRSGASRVRGGFDSHAFPPSLRAARFAAIACGIMALAATQAAAGPAPALQDTASGRVIELPLPPADPKTGAQGEAKPARAPLPRHALTGFDAPRWVMARSLVVPGWGQLHNGSWIKAIGVAACEGLLAVRALDDKRKLDVLDAEVQAARRDNDEVREVLAVEAYNDRLNRLVAREWLLGALVSYALLDAYIDAHFRDFELEFRHDPALPEGVPKRSGIAGETRIALGWRF